MTRDERQFARLKALEGDYVKRLVGALRPVADRDDALIFDVSQNPFDPHVSREASKLEDAAHEILQLRRELSLDGVCAAALFVRHCDAHTDDHRLGPGRQARALLDELPVDDLWFRSELMLEQLGSALGLADVAFDAENYWEWIIGELSGVELDMTRPHALPPLEVDTRIFRLDLAAFDDEMIDVVVARLRGIGVSSVKGGKWVYRSGEDFDLVEIREYD